MPFTTPDYQAIRDAILRDIVNQQPAAVVGSDSDYAVRASAVASAIEGLYQHQQWLVRQILPDTADTDYLEQHAGLHGLTRKAATAATGSIGFTGTPDSAVPIGTEAKSLGGVTFVTTAAGVVGGDGTATIAAQAAVVGVVGNLPAATALTLTAAPAGVQSQASIVSMTGGVDLENDAGLLARLLDRIRTPPHGGAKHDYIAWARSVPGVERAYVYPLRRGDGTVDVAIRTEGGTPSGALLTEVQTYLDEVRPVTADCLVLAPAEVVVDVTASLILSGTTLAAVSVLIEAALAAYFGGLQPGDTAYRNRIAAVIADTPGVVDFNLAAPLANVATLADATAVQIAVLGTVTLS